MSQTVTMTLTEFLLARIAEDERRCGDVHHVNCAYTRIPERECTCGNPARVLAECDAKRRIVEWHRPKSEALYEFEDPEDWHAGQCSTCGYGESWQAQEYGPTFPCGTIRALALPYADHPDYQESWRV